MPCKKPACSVAVWSPGGWGLTGWPQGQNPALFLGPARWFSFIDETRSLPLLFQLMDQVDTSRERKSHRSPGSSHKRFYRWFPAPWMEPTSQRKPMQLAEQWCHMCWMTSAPAAVFCTSCSFWIFSNGSHRRRALQQSEAWVPVSRTYLVYRSAYISGKRVLLQWFIWSFIFIIFGCPETPSTLSSGLTSETRF